MMIDQNNGLDILIIDDNEADRVLYHRYLSRSPDISVRIRDVETGEEGVEAVAVQRPDCILLDFNLPDMDALEVLQKLGKLAGDAKLPPVVVLTGAGSERVAVEVMKAGASDYLVKGQLTAVDLVLSITAALHLAHTQEELAQAYIGLESKNKQLHDLAETAQRFVDNVAHDFRTPLTVIKAFASILQKDLASDDRAPQQEHLDYIGRAADELADMVNDFLDSSKLKNNVLPMDRKSHSVAALFDHVRDTVRARGLNQEIRFVEQIEPDLPQVYIDLPKAGRVLVNLAVNAIKFSPVGGEVTLWAKRQGQGVAVGVTDHGPGISEQDLEKLCNRFSQIDGAQSMVEKGFGLGLSIAKELAWLNLGEIQIQSVKGTGSSFSFTMPSSDLSSIMESQIDTLNRMQKPQCLALISVNSDDPEITPQKLQQFLGNKSYAMDLQLVLGEDKQVSVVGATTEPDQWVQRLCDAWEQQFPDKPITVGILKTWNLPMPIEALVEQLLGSHRKLRKSA